MDEMAIFSEPFHGYDSMHDMDLLQADASFQLQSQHPDGQITSESSKTLPDGEWNAWWEENVQPSENHPSNGAPPKEDPAADDKAEQTAPYATHYGDQWFSEQIAHIPILNGESSYTSQIIQLSQNPGDGQVGYVLVPDKELAAILGGHVDKDTIYWLLANFKLERNAVMPRGFLYNKYEGFCGTHGKPLMNQACMGKTVRALFRGLETRRLGRRGKSRYHYIGLAINPEGEFAGQVPLEPEDVTGTAEGERKRRRTTLASKKAQENPVGKQFENLDPDNRLDAALDQLEKLLGSKRNRYILPYRLRNNDNLFCLLPHEQLPDGLSKEDLQSILTDLRIHLALLGHTILNGILTSVCSILENFWLAQCPSLQLHDKFNQAKFRIALQWAPFVDLIGYAYVELYGAVIEQIIPKHEKALNSQVLDFFHEFTTKYCQWVRVIASQVSAEVNAVMTSAAIAFTQCLKQVIVLNSALGLVELVERDRTKASIIADGFKTVSERMNICSITASEEECNLSLQNGVMMELVAGSDHMLQRWRGWVKTVIDAKLERINKRCGDKKPKEAIVAKKGQKLELLRSMWNGQISELQRHVERCAKDFSTPMVFMLNYFQYSTNFFLDQAVAKIHEKTLIQQAYVVSRHNLMVTDYLANPPQPNYEITFFTNRLISMVDINVFDYHFYSRFDELKLLMHCPKYAATSRLDDFHLTGGASLNFDEDRAAAEELMVLENGNDTFRIDDFVQSLGCNDKTDFSISEQITHHFGVEESHHEYLRHFMPGHDYHTM